MGEGCAIPPPTAEQQLQQMYCVGLIQAAGPTRRDCMDPMKKYKVRVKVSHLHYRPDTHWSGLLKWIRIHTRAPVLHDGRTQFEFPALKTDLLLWPKIWKEEILMWRKQNNTITVSATDHSRSTHINYGLNVDIFTEVHKPIPRNTQYRYRAIAAQKPWNINELEGKYSDQEACKHLVKMPVRIYKS